MLTRHWLRSVVMVAVLGSGAAYAAPVISVQPQDFGSVRVASAATTTAVLTFDIQNTGDTTLTITGVQIMGTDAGDFTIMAGPGPNTDVAPSEAVEITVVFDPQAPGPRSATLEITSNDPASPTSSALTGTGTSALISVTDVTFGIVTHGTTTTGTTTVSNAAAANQGPLHVTSAAIDGGDGWFTFDTNGAADCQGDTTCTFGVDVPPDLLVGVRCSPPAGATGDQTATLTFTSDGELVTGADPVATLSCTAGRADLDVMTASLAFGDVPVNPSPAPSQSITIGNAGNQTLTFNAAVVASPFSSFYTLGGCATACAVAPGTTEQFTVTFNPTSPTIPDANVDIEVVPTNDPDTASVTIPVTGRGVGALIDAPTSLPSFDDVEVGKLSGTQTLTITNTGNAPLVISDASFASGGSDYIAMTGTTGPQMTTVPPMGSVSWDLVCQPSTHGSRPGTFRIASNSTAQSLADVSLACTGRQGVLAVSVPGGGTLIDFGSVAEGVVDTETFTLSNTGNVTVLGIAAVVDPATAGYSIDPAGNPVPSSLAPGASVTLTVRFAPLGSAAGGPADITFTGDWGVTPTQTTAVLELDGTGLTADYELVPDTIDFGDLRFDTTLDRTFCIRNSGQAALQIVDPMPIAPTSPTVTGEFLVVDIRRPTACGAGDGTTGLTLPQPLTAGQVLEVTVRADPDDRAGLLQATLTVNSSLSVSPTRTLSLLGNSTTGAFTLAPGSLVDFGAVDVQGPPATQTIKITNNGTGPLDLTGFQRTADAEFTFTLPPDTTLQPTQALDIVVTYKPVVASPAGSEETVTLSHAIAGDLDGPTSQAIVLRGRGIDRDLELAATPAFPDTFRNPGDLAPVRGARIRNLGEAALKVSAVMLDNGAGVWELLDASPVEIPQGATQEFRVRFAPRTAGRAEAKLLITHDDDARPPVSIDLVGNGLDRAVRFTPDTIRIGYTPVGVPVTIEGALVVTSMDPSHAFRITDIRLDEGSPFAIGGLAPELELGPLAERRFAVTFTPDAQGVFTTKARLLLDMDPEATHEVTIEGTAVFVDARGGGGCAAGGSAGAGGAIVLVLALAGLLGRRRRRGWSALVVASALALAPVPARADDIALSVFDPVPATASNGFQLQSPDVGASGDWVASAVISHATDPLILDGIANGVLINDYAVISRSTVTNLGLAVALLDRLEVGARMPLYVQSGQPAGDPTLGFTGQPAEGTASGDLALHAKLRLVRKRLAGDGAFLAGLAGQLTLPTATRNQFAGVEDPSGRVLLLGSLMPGAFQRRLTLTMNLGAVIRAPSTFANLEQKSGVAWGLGTELRALDSLSLAAEVYGDTVPSGRTDAMTRSRVLSPIEWLAGLRWRPERRLIVGLAAGRGLTSAVGTPSFRGVLSLTIAPGAPEPRPIRPPKPDGDGDRDGVRDSADRCASEPEDRDLFDDADGCPDPDNDGDQIADGQDRCPIEAEDKDGVDDADGCIDRDNDADGIADTLDKCPMKAEDKDGFADTDGCPEDDNDRDGILDRADRCPAVAETINGNSDDDGCPDKGDSLVVLSPDRLETLDTIQFTANHKIAKASQSLLGQIGATLRARTEIARLRITVHVQPTSDPDRDQELSDKRAAAVREWLVQWGVEPARVEARGFGGNKPLVPPDRKGAAALNQRVELIILERR